MKTWSNLGVPSTEAPTGNLVWVDQINGNDSLAVRGRMSIPFRTLTAAKNAAQSGDTIMVMPGTYNENGLVKNGVNWHFLNGAKVIYTGAAGGAIFGPVGAAVSFAVTGQGEFGNEATGGDSLVLYSSYSADSIVFEARKAYSNNSNALQLSGAVVVRSGELKSVNATTVYLNSGSSTTIRADKITSSGSHAIEIHGGTHDIDAVRITATGAAGVGVKFYSNTDAQVSVRAFEIRSSNDHGVEYADSYSHTLTLYAQRIVATTGGKNAIRSSVSSFLSGTGDIRLHGGCALVVNGSGGNFSLYAASAVVPMRLYGTVVANQVASFTPKVCALTTSGDVL
jgi:hypothetical protein